MFAMFQSFLAILKFCTDQSLLFVICFCIDSLKVISFSSSTDDSTNEGNTNCQNAIYGRAVAEIRGTQAL